MIRFLLILLSLMAYNGSIAQQKVLKMNPQQKDALKKQITSEEGKAVSEEVTKIMTTKLTPDERRDFAKVSQFWIRTLKEL